MLVTEQQAKEMFCPMPRHESADYHCAGSRCMWWRWGSGWDNETKTYTTTYRKTPIKDSPGHFDNAPLGYCGMAGTQGRRVHVGRHFDG